MVEVRDFTKDLESLAKHCVLAAAHNHKFEYIGKFESQHIAISEGVLAIVISQPDVDGKKAASELSKYLTLRGWRVRNLAIPGSMRLNGEDINYVALMRVHRNKIDKGSLIQLREFLFDYRKKMGHNIPDSVPSDYDGNI